jgi:hypothetical protein
MLRNTSGKPAAGWGQATATSGEWLTAASPGVDLTDKNISCCVGEVLGAVGGEPKRSPRYPSHFAMRATASRISSAEPA